MKKIIFCVFAMLLLWNCKTIPEPAEKLYYIAASQENLPVQRSGGCSFRYKTENTYSRLDNELQQQAIRAAFNLWQNADQNILFLQKQDSDIAEIKIRFEAFKTISKTLKSPVGLIKGDITTLSSYSFGNKTYTVSLDPEYVWDSQSLTRVLAWHIGNFLGLQETEETGSMLNPIYIKEAIRLSESDSLGLNALYTNPCENSCNTFLPVQLSVGELTVKNIRIDKPGKISISATGRMVVGFWIGWSTPDGLENGLFNVPIGDYSIDRRYNHAALIYKINNEPSWRYCGGSCEFETDGVSQCIDLTLGINDLNLTDDTGAYDVVVNYKK